MKWRSWTSKRGNVYVTMGSERYGNRPYVFLLEFYRVTFGIQKKEKW